MNEPTPCDLRRAVGIAVVLTALLTLALVDLSRGPTTSPPPAGPTRSVAPR